MLKLVNASDERYRLMMRDHAAHKRSIPGISRLDDDIDSLVTLVLILVILSIIILPVLVIGLARVAYSIAQHYTLVCVQAWRQYNESTKR